MDKEGRFLTVFLDLHDSCNLGCRMCHFGFRQDKPGRPHFISIENFRKIADEIFPFTSELALSPCTEPLFYNRFSEILKIINEYGIPNPWLMTNANLLTEELSANIIDANITRLLISMDSHIKEIYEKIKIGASFDVLIGNIKRLRRLKEERQSKLPDINFNCLLMRTNIEYLEPYLEFVKTIGGTRVGFFHVIIFKEAVRMKGESLFLHKELANRCLERISRKAAELGIGIERIPERFSCGESVADAAIRPGGPTVRKKRNCRYPWSYLVIDCRGNIRPCEFWFEEPFGNILREPFKRIWNNGKYMKLRDELSKGRLSRRCCINCVSMSAPDGNVNDERAFLEVAS